MKSDGALTTDRVVGLGNDLASFAVRVHGCGICVVGWRVGERRGVWAGRDQVYTSIAKCSKMQFDFSCQCFELAVILEEGKRKFRLEECRRLFEVRDLSRCHDERLAGEAIEVRELLYYFTVIGK